MLTLLLGLAQAGVAEAEARTVSGGARLYDAEGRVVARLPRRRGPHPLYVTGRRDGRVDVVITEWEGYVWRGQLEERALAPQEGGGAGGLGLLGGIVGEGSRPELRACPSDTVLLLNEGFDHWPLGTLLAGAPFEILVQDPSAGPLVRIPNGPLYLDEGYRLRLPPGAERCPIAD